MTSRSLGHILKCDSHPDAFLIEDHRAGDMICSQCGLVVGDRMIDVCSEWRTFANDEGKDNCRVGAAEDPMLGGSDLSTTIGRATGSAGFDENGMQLYRNRSVESASDKAKKKANKDIREMAERLSADQSIITSAQYIFHTIQKSKIVKGRSNNAIIAACMFVACRQQSVPRTFKEISAVTNGEVGVKDIGRCYKLILKTLVLTPISNNITSASANDLIDRFCSKLKLPINVKKLATIIIRNVNEIATLTSRSPNSLAAAAIFLAADKIMDASTRPSTELIGQVCGAAENTIKQTLKLMQNEMSKIMPNEVAAVKPLHSK